MVSIIHGLISNALPGRGGGGTASEDRMGDGGKALPPPLAIPPSSLTNASVATL